MASVTLKYNLQFLLVTGGGLEGKASRNKQERKYNFAQKETAVPHLTGILIFSSILLKYSNCDLSNYIAYFLEGGKRNLPFRIIEDNQLPFITDTQKVLKSVTLFKVI